MRPRKYINRIEVWQYAPDADGYGGNDQTETKIGESWCNIKTVPVYKLTDYGLNETRKAITVTLRKRNDIDYEDSELFLKYNGDSYQINRVTEIDLNGYEVQILATA